MRTLSKAQSAAVARNRERAFASAEVSFVSAVERRRILHERALLLARELEAEAEVVEEMDIVVFDVGGRDLAVECPFARESHLIDEVTPLVCTPDYVMGIVNIRGVIVPVIDLRKVLSLDSPTIPIQRILVVESDLGPVGFQIDSLAGVRTVPKDLVTLGDQAAEVAEYFRGRTQDGIAVLDVASMIARTRVGRADDDEAIAE